MIRDLQNLAQSMVQGSLSEMTRQCGDPSCACASDPARRHGPHLYFKFNAAGKAHSVYVPTEQAGSIKDAQQAWVQFQQRGTEISAANREQWLQGLKRDKQAAKARRERRKA